MLYRFETLINRIPGIRFSIRSSLFKGIQEKIPTLMTSTGQTAD